MEIVRFDVPLPGKSRENLSNSHTSSKNYFFDVSNPKLAYRYCNEKLGFFSIMIVYFPTYLYLPTSWCKCMRKQKLKLTVKIFPSAFSLSPQIPPQYAVIRWAIPILNSPFLFPTPSVVRRLVLQTG